MSSCTLTGGGEVDTFVFRSWFNRDTITDFRPDDVIEFQSGMFGGFPGTFSDVLRNAVQDGNNVVLSAGGDTLILRDVQRTSLAPDDFQFSFSGDDFRSF